MEEYSQVFYLLSLCFSIFSIFCIFLVFAVIILSRFSREDSYKVLALSLLADGILLAGFCLDARNQSLCQIQGLLANWGSLATLTWAGIIMMTQYTKILYDFISPLKYYSIIGFLLPGLVAGLEYSLGFYDKSSIYCGISTNSNELAVSIFVNFCPIVFAAFFCICLSIKIEEFFKEFDSGYRPEEYTEKLKTFSQSKKYSWCFIITNAAFGIYTSFYWVNQKRNVLIDVIGLLASTLSGYLISLVFLFSVFGSNRKGSKVSELVPSSTSVQSS